MSLIALDDAGTRIYARQDGPQNATCVECGTRMYRRLSPEGNYTDHWAHMPEAERECATDPGKMTEWHRAWQGTCTDPERLEVWNKDRTRRADVYTPHRLAVEFQHSSMSPDTIKARQNDWRHRLVWVFDMLDDTGLEGRANVYQLPDWPETNPDLFRVTWPNPRHFWCHTKTATFLDVRRRMPGEERMLLQVLEWKRDKDGKGWCEAIRWDRQRFIDEVVNGDARPAWPAGGEKPRRKSKKSSSRGPVVTCNKPKPQPVPKPQPPAPTEGPRRSSRPSVTRNRVESDWRDSDREPLAVATLNRPCDTCGRHVTFGTPDEGACVRTWEQPGCASGRVGDAA